MTDPQDNEETLTAPVDWQEVLQPLLAQESAFRAFVRRRLSDEALAEDVLQQSLVRAVERQHTLDQPDNVVAWFYRILRNAIVDVYRARAAEARKTEAFEKEVMVIGGDRSPAPDELQPTICACLERLLPALRPAYADLLRRIDLEGQSSEDVAQALQITQNNLTVRLHRARQALRTSLERTCGLCTKHGCVQCTCEQEAVHRRL